jgi:hypothetical protein
VSERLLASQGYYSMELCKSNHVSSREAAINELGKMSKEEVVAYCKSPIIYLERLNKSIENLLG